MAQPAQQFENIKADDVRPCDICEGALVPCFMVIDVRMAVIDERNANQLMAMHQYFEGRAPELAKFFSPGADAIGKILDDPDTRTRLYACMSCMMDKLIELQIALEARDEAKAEADQVEASG